MRLLSCESDIVQVLRVALALHLHEQAIRIGAALVLENSKGLATLGLTLVDDIHLIGRMLLEKVA
jgi:hypothetical protein